MEKELLLYTTRDGKIPFNEWLEGLTRENRARIRMRLNRVRLGNLGDWKSVGNGVKELREHRGPGYRIYIAERGNVLVILLCAGDKGTQEADIKRAMIYLEDYETRTS